MESDITVLEWDTGLFGFKVARIDHAQMSTGRLSDSLNELKNEEFRLVYWCSDREDKESQQAAKENNGILADEKVTYVMPLTQLDFAPEVELYNEELPTQELMELAFSVGHESRFFLDKNMPKESYKKVYQQWMVNSVNKSIADDVLVIRDNNKVVGMVTLGVKNKRGDIGLIAVADGYQGRGYGRKLVQSAQSYFWDGGLQEGQVVTQLTNKSACALYEKCGYRVESIDNFYHFWL